MTLNIVDPNLTNSNKATTNTRINPNNIILKCENLKKTYQDADKYIQVLDNCNFSIHEGERVAIVGRSGSGKTTLVNLLGGLELPTSGEVIFNNTSLRSLSDRARGKLRNNFLGLIFQFHYLLPEFTALENVAMPLLIRGMATNKAKELSHNALDKVMLSHRTTHKPSQLSGGERQRVAIARAIVTRPKCVLADEPTGNLDNDSADNVYDLMLDLTKEVGTSFIVVTHDMNLANKMDRIVKLHKGQLQEV